MNCKMYKMYPSKPCTTQCSCSSAPLERIWNANVLSHVCKGDSEEKWQKLSERKSHILFTCKNSTFECKAPRQFPSTSLSKENTSSFFKTIMGQVQRTSAICTGSPTTKRGSSCYPAGTTLHIILPQIQRTTNNNVVVCYHASSNTTQSCNHTNIICYIAKVNFYHSKTKKKMCLILNFSITTNRDIKLFVATCLAFYY